MGITIGVDVGGTATRIAAFRGGQELGRKTFPTDPQNYALWRILLDSHIAHLLLDDIIVDDVVVVGVGVAGKIEDGVLVGSGNLPGWQGKNVRDDLADRLGVPVTVMNDCAAAALGEYSTYRTPLIYVIWGTGVGVSVVTETDSGPFVRPTELGHMPLYPHSPLKCGCGGYGHLEAFVGGGNLENRFGKSVLQLGEEEWQQVLDDMAFGLRSISCGDMDLPIVLGGGVAYKQRHRLPALQELIHKLEASPNPPDLQLAFHGEDSGLVGAAYAASQFVPA